MRSEPALGRRLEMDVAAMAAHDILGDGEAEADAAGRWVARAFETIEGPKHRLALIDGDARPIIVDHDLDRGAIGISMMRPFMPRNKPAMFDVSEGGQMRPDPRWRTRHRLRSKLKCMGSLKNLFRKPRF